MGTDRILDLYFSQYATSSPDPFCPEILTWNLRDLHSFWIKTSHNQNESDIPYWSIVWPGGRALARYILDHPDTVKNKTVLDFASGSGIVGVGAILAGAKSIHFVDISPEAIAMTRKTLELNGLDPDSAAFSFVTSPDQPFTGFDVILAGDIFYEEELAKQSLTKLKEVAARGTICIVGDPGRNHRPDRGFNRLKTYRVPVLREVESVKTRDVDILKIT